MHPMPTAAIVWNGNGNRAAVVEQKVATRRLCRTYRMPTAVVGFCVPPDPSKVRKICYLEQIINDIFECSLVWNKDAGVIMVVLKAQPRYFNKPWSVNICNFHDKINLLYSIFCSRIAFVHSLHRKGNQDTPNIFCRNTPSVRAHMYFHNQDQTHNAYNPDIQIQLSCYIAETATRAYPDIMPIIRDSIIIQRGYSECFAESWQIKYALMTCRAPNINKTLFIIDMWSTSLPLRSILIKPVKDIFETEATFVPRFHTEPV